MQQVKILKETKGLSATVYTQLTDTETEVNGLLFYNRVPKIPIEKIRAANEFNYKAPNYKELLPLSKTSPQTWKYTFNTPSGPKNAWIKLGYDDSKWEEGIGGFGANHRHVGTQWPKKTKLWVRKSFHLGKLTPEELDRTVITLYCIGLMGDTYINGVKFAIQHTANRLIGSPLSHRPLTKKVRQALVMDGENVIAIQFNATTHKEYLVDVGLAVREE